MAGVGPPAVHPGLGTGGRRAGAPGALGAPRRLPQPEPPERRPPESPPAGAAGEPFPPEGHCRKAAAFPPPLAAHRPGEQGPPLPGVRTAAHSIGAASLGPAAHVGQPPPGAGAAKEQRLPAEERPERPEKAPLAHSPRRLPGGGLRDGGDRAVLLHLHQRRYRHLRREGAGLPLQRGGGRGGPGGAGAGHRPYPGPELYHRRLPDSVLLRPPAPPGPGGQGGLRGGLERRGGHGHRRLLPLRGWGAHRGHALPGSPGAAAKADPALRHQRGHHLRLLCRECGGQGGIRAHRQPDEPGLCGRNPVQHQNRRGHLHRGKGRHLV